MYRLKIWNVAPKSIGIYKSGLSTATWTDLRDEGRINEVDCNGRVR